MTTTTKSNLSGAFFTKANTGHDTALPQSENFF